ncbi:MAG TPA: glucose 1-dehydrogenase [Gemmatimonadales bacterium]|jgi:NAD(P)-dependent dehydrogenase (short-subunit alcohol dehydrogenase family)
MTVAAKPVPSTPAAPAPPARRLAGKIALITGGNSGIGLATAEEFLKAGASVVITGRDPGTLQSASSRLRELAAADRLVAMRADVTVAQQVDHAMQEVRARFGRLDVLFVNAGIAEFVPIAEVTEQHFDRIFAANVKGAYFTIQKALPLLAPGASIILNSSIAGMLGMPATSVYAASKAAVRSLARTLSADLVDRGIRVNVISPGPVATPILDRVGLSPEAREDFAARVPLKRLGDPREIAHAAVFLASDESTFLVGAELVADGGMSQL